MEMSYSLDDVLLEPQFSDINSRLHVSTKTSLTKNFALDIPIMATNMDSISEYAMMERMWQNGGVACLHRFMTPEKNIDIMKHAKSAGISPLMVSVGVGNEEYERALALASRGADIILIDVAHGHSKQVLDQYRRLEGKVLSDLVIGNIATYQAAKEFLNFGVDGLRVGVGGGARCLTRTQTGHGVANLTALLNVVRARDEYFKQTEEYVPIILDGGIKSPGDIVKALYFGADVACIGNLLAGTDETPGDVIHKENGQFKKYYGLASKEAQDNFRGGLKPGTTIEGYSAPVPYKGPVQHIIDDLVGGIRSGLTYSGARTIDELRKNGVPYLLSSAAQTESKLHR